MTDLSPRALNILRQLVCGQKLDEVPEELLRRRLVQAERWKKQPDLVRMVWTATKAGRMLIAQSEGEKENGDG